MKYDLNNPYKLQCAEEYFKTLKEKKAVIELKELRFPHSVDSQRLYWLWLNCIAKQAERNKDELHLLYRAKFLPKDEDYILSILKDGLWPKIKKRIEDFEFFPGMGDVIDIISYSTAIYTKEAKDSKEFSDYLKEIQKHARVYFNVILLNKNDQNFAEFYREYGFI